MFYVKEKINDGTEIRIELTEENVFCSCPGCDAEVSVDLSEIFVNEYTDLYGTQVFCEECTRKRSLFNP